MPKKTMPQKSKSPTSETYQIHLVPVAQLKYNPNNPRVIEDASFLNLVESVTLDGFMLAIRFLVVDKDWVVLGGNQRLKACRSAGIESVYVVKAEDLSPAQLKEFIFKDNLYFGEFDKDRLSAGYTDTELVDIGLSLIDASNTPLEVYGCLANEIDESQNQKKKEVYENNQVKQITCYFPADLHEKILMSIDLIKRHMGIEDNSQMLLNLIANWKQNYAG